jgi:hypothetical protein
MLNIPLTYIDPNTIWAYVNLTTMVSYVGYGSRVSYCALRKISARKTKEQITEKNCVKRSYIIHNLLFT